MPNFNGTGPNGAGPMTGGGYGRCGGSHAADRGYGAGRGQGMGQGAGFSHRGQGCGGNHGRGMGLGRGMGWMALGYGGVGDAAAAANVKNALEARKVFLSAELARTEALLSESASDGTALANQN